MIKYPEAIFALIGTSIGIVASLITLIINRRFDDRRDMRKLAIEAALEEWKHEVDVATRYGETMNVHVEVAPLDSYIIHRLKVAELISNKRITAENVEEELRRIRDISQAAMKAAEQKK